MHPAGGEPRPTLLAVGAGALLLVQGVRTFRLGTAVTLSLIEALMAARLAWGILIDPAWIHDRSIAGFGVQAALLIVTFLSRQSWTPGGGGEEEEAATLMGFLHAVWLCALFEAVWGLGQALQAGAARFETGPLKTPLVGTLGAPNAFGALMALGLAAALGVALTAVPSRLPGTGSGTRGVEGSGWPRRAALGAVPVLGVALFLNGSRGAVLGLAAAAALILWVRRVFRAPRDPATARRSFVATAGLVATLGVVALGLHRLAPESGRGRLITWSIAAAMVRDHPVRGVGPGRFGVEHPVYQAAYFRDPAHSEETHKATYLQHALGIYVTSAAETGTVGAILFVLPWLLAVVVLARPPGKRAAAPGRLPLLAVLGTFLVHGAVDSVLLVPVLAAVAHGALGLVPAPSWVWRVGARRTRRAAALAGAIGLAALVAVPPLAAYPSRILWQRGVGATNPERAVALLRTAEAGLPWHGHLAGDLGRALLRDGRPGEAVEPLRRALDLYGDPDFHIDLSRALLAVGDTAGARIHADSARAIYPDRLGPRLAEARVHRAASRDAAAREALTRCILRETRIQSDAVEAVAKQAEELWRAWYDDPPPTPTATPRADLPGRRRGS